MDFIQQIPLLQVSLNAMTKLHSKPIDISPRKMLNINYNHDLSQQEQLVELLQQHQTEFASEYTDMKGIHPDLCTHHIYIKY